MDDSLQLLKTLENYNDSVTISMWQSGTVRCMRLKESREYLESGLCFYRIFYKAYTGTRHDVVISYGVVQF